MKKLYGHLVLLMASAICHAEGESWKWADYSSAQYLKSNQPGAAECEMLCRAKKHHTGGVVNQSSGLCELPVSKKALKEYQVHRSGHKGQFKWYDKDIAACHLWFRATTGKDQAGEWSNCYINGDRYCRFQKNDALILGVVDSQKQTCVSYGNESSSAYQLYQFEFPPYHNYERGVWLFIMGSFTTAMLAISCCLE